MKNKKINVFREESLENISAPEQLADYLRIANPSSWLVLFALILLFGGLVVWSSIGQLETVAGGANRFIASLLAGLTLATAMTTVAAAAAEDTSTPTGYVTEVDMEDDELVLDFDADTEKELMEESAETNTTTAFEEVALPTTEEKEKEKD